MTNLKKTSRCVYYNHAIISILVLLVTPCVRCFSSSTATMSGGVSIPKPVSTSSSMSSGSSSSGTGNDQRLKLSQCWSINCKKDGIESTLNEGSTDDESKISKRGGNGNNAVSPARRSLILGAGLFVGSMSFSGGAYADEVGVSVDAPVLFTGEEIMICTKRGPLGACKSTVKRTKENDNDKATKYFNDPELAFQEKYKAAQLQAIEDERNGVVPATSADFDGNALIAQLKEKSRENKEKNDGIVRQKTLANNLGANYGPFSSKVPILNADGVDYTLLDAPMAMRLKKAGYIGKDRRFITQPPQQALDDAAAEAEGSLVGKVNRFVREKLGKEDDEIFF